MNIDWYSTVFNEAPPDVLWGNIFSMLLDIASKESSPVYLHDATVVPDRLLSEAAWELWDAYPEHAPKTSNALREWTNQGLGKAVLILDALSLRELPGLVSAAKNRGVQIRDIKVTGSECPSTTDFFARAIGMPSRSAMANDAKPGTFKLFSGNCYTDVLSLPFEDCTVPVLPNLVIWHSWLDDLIHLQNKNPDQIANITSKELQGDGFWQFIDRLRTGRSLVITSDHGYGVSKRFSSEVDDPAAIEIFRKTFGASRNKPATEPWASRFMPPVVMNHNGQYVVAGQRKWSVQGGFPTICHGGMSLLEVAVPYMEVAAI